MTTLLASTMHTVGAWVTVMPDVSRQETNPYHHRKREKLMKYHVTYTRVLTMEGEIDALTEREADALAEERSALLLNADYSDADCSWDVELAEEPEIHPETEAHEGNQDVSFDQDAWKASLRQSARDVGVEMNDTDFDAFAQLALEHW